MSVQKPTDVDVAVKDDISQKMVPVTTICQLGGVMFMLGGFIGAIIVAAANLGGGGGGNNKATTTADSCTNPPVYVSQNVMTWPDVQTSGCAFDDDPIMVPIGSTTALSAEATDCAYSDSCTAVDGESGDTDFAYGNIKALCTIGEYDETTGYM